MKPSLLAAALLCSLPLSVYGKEFTQECIQKAGFSSCSTFNSCCDFRCSRARQKRSTCTANSTGINTVQTECVCSPLPPSAEFTVKKKLSRLDVIAGVLFLFVIDMLLLSFTF